MNGIKKLNIPGIARGRLLELVEKVQDDLVERQLVLEHQSLVTDVVPALKDAPPALCASQKLIFEV